ncbi:hypothetical protein WN944_023445 [Citrus x changshan-huyou]|uniref:NB-ARC domain-containing protein n=1 Tax=Citrus x changshan-huyou TaxID=2935761 RepID=A0AAP0R191_9ROSI
MASVGDIWNVVKDCIIGSFYLYSNSRDLKDKVDTLSVKKVLYWLARVPEYTNENGKVDFLLQRAEEEKAKQCLGCCSVNCFSVYYFSLEVVKMTEDLQGLIDEGKGFKKDVADPPPQPVVERQDMKNVVGMESILDEVWGCFEDDCPWRIICLYGVRGVGKTTLLENLNSKFSDTTHNFDLVILVKASAGAINIETIQQVMRYRLAIPNEVWDNKNQQVNELKNYPAEFPGESIIDSLIRVCLLEEVQTYFGNYVKMHDMLRDLALWIASQDKGNKILASKPENVTSLVPRPLSLRRFFKKSPTPAPPSCPRLLTLLVRYASMKGLPEWFFQSMPALRVLEWSRNGDLTKLPMQKGELINLRYLNLSDTDISQLPIEIKRCCQLIILLLDGTEKLKAIPKGLLSELSALQVFSRVPTHYDSHEDKSSGLGVNVSLLEELESLKHIQDTSVVLSTLDSVEKFQSSSKLQSCIRRLIIENPSSTSSITKMLHDADFRNLQDLFISNCFPNI